MGYITGRFVDLALFRSGLQYWISDFMVSSYDLLGDQLYYNSKV